MHHVGQEYCAGIAQLVEYKLPKLGVAGSTPVARSICNLISLVDPDSPFSRLLAPLA